MQKSSDLHARERCCRPTDRPEWPLVSQSVNKRIVSKRYTEGHPDLDYYKIGFMKFIIIVQQLFAIWFAVRVRELILISRYLWSGFCASTVPESEDGMTSQFMDSNPRIRETRFADNLLCYWKIILLEGGSATEELQIELCIRIKTSVCNYWYYLALHESLVRNAVLWYYCRCYLWFKFSRLWAFHLIGLCIIWFCFAWLN